MKCEREKKEVVEVASLCFEDLRLRTSLELVSGEWHPDVGAASNVLLPVVVVVVVVAQARD